MRRVTWTIEKYAVSANTTSSVSSLTSYVRTRTANITATSRTTLIPVMDLKRGEVMDDLIRRKDAIEAVGQAFLWSYHFSPKPINDAKKDCISGIKAIPAVEPRRGSWIPLVMNGEYKCSVCGRASRSDNAAWVNIPSAYWNFCPNCGADMRERKESE